MEGDGCLPELSLPPVLHLLREPSLYLPVQVRVDRLFLSFFGAAATSVASALSGRRVSKPPFSTYRVDSYSARKAVASSPALSLRTPYLI
ncbi:hypothetical protein VTO73DRAFT_13294 [Trametes versicolor]